MFMEGVYDPMMEPEEEGEAILIYRTTRTSPNSVINVSLSVSLLASPVPEKAPSGYFIVRFAISSQTFSPFLLPRR